MPKNEEMEDGSYKRNSHLFSSGSKKVMAFGDYGGFGRSSRKLISLNKGLSDDPADFFRPQDADYSYVPSLRDELALLILARVPRTQYSRLCRVNRRYHALVRSGELYAVRREIGIQEPSILMLPSGEPHWWCYDPRSGSRRNLPALPSDLCFLNFDKETICAGTHLIVSGKEIGGAVIWRYELAVDQWFKGPPMISSRCLFASANCDSVACVAGGIGVGRVAEVLSSAEKYNPDNKTWDPLPRMNRRRKLCSGCYMDSKFYVIGGQNEKGENLTCGEFYDPERNAWELVPDMVKDSLSLHLESPPLVAVVNNELYLLEASSNKLKVYMKNTNSWKDLGGTPARTDHSRGWGVAFKSMESELLVIGSRADNNSGRGMVICTCTPDPDLDALHWRIHPSDSHHRSSFIFNCSVMMA